MWTMCYPFLEMDPQSLGSDMKAGSFRNHFLIFSISLKLRKHQVLKTGYTSMW